METHIIDVIYMSQPVPVHVIYTTITIMLTLHIKDNDAEDLTLLDIYNSMWSLQ